MVKVCGCNEMRCLRIKIFKSQGDRVRPFCPPTRVYKCSETRRLFLINRVILFQGALLIFVVYRNEFGARYVLSRLRGGPLPFLFFFSLKQVTNRASFVRVTI